MVLRRSSSDKFQMRKKLTGDEEAYRRDGGERVVVVEFVLGGMVAVANAIRCLRISRDGGGKRK